MLGYDSPEEIGPEITFKELGFDSLGAVDLRNRLSIATGLELPATLIFNYPTPSALAGYMLEQVSSTADAAPVSVEDGLRQLESALTSEAPSSEERAKIGSRLRALAVSLQASERHEEENDVVERIEGASAAELFELVEREWSTDPVVGVAEDSDGNGAR